MAFTFPFASTVAIFFLLLLYRMPNAALPDGSFTLSRRVFPFFSVLFFAPIVTFFGACLTVTLMRQVFWFAVVTVITAFPFFFARITPPCVTLATLLLLLL